MHYHIVGVAGAGMSAIATILLDQGHTVSGSDLAANSLTAALAERGAALHVGHAAAHVAGADAVLATAAVRPDHVELAAARAAGIPVVGRAELWRQWSRERAVVAVAGTHGKTTTSAMIATALRGAGVPCGYLIGSSVPDLGGNAAWGDPAAPLVIEADEYDRVFLALAPAIAVITNVEWDHPDIYPSADDYHAAFRQFATQARALVVCGDDPGVEALGLGDATFYGIEEALASDPVSCRLAPLDWTASGVTATPAGGVGFDLWRYNRRRMAQQRVGSQGLRLPGAHNVRNALAALAACAALGADMAAASDALARFGGTARRFELKGEVGGVTVIDDYAHHPTEARATLAAARGRYPGRRIVAYLQPHTFSRTTALLDDWALACGDADLLLVGDIYAAREQGDAPALARALSGRIAAAGVDARPVGDVAAAGTALAALARSGDVVLTLGAGDGDRVGMALLDYLRGADAPAGQRTAPQEPVTPPIAIREHEPMERHTSWRAGGAARYYAEPASPDEARALAAWARATGIPLVWAGRGTNMLVRDEGFPGLIAAYRGQAWELDEVGETALLRVEAGAPMAGVARRLGAMGWAGLEWAEGLPGTVGGAVFGNAGCYGGDTAGILVSAELLVGDTIERWPLERLGYGYRTSALKQLAARGPQPAALILAATFRLTRGDPAELAARTAAIAAERKRKTPSGSSCGSVFKNPPGDSAGRLIEAAGLKGLRAGAAVISPVHANYIVTTGGAAAADILALVEAARAAVRERFGVELELEVRVI